MAEPVPWWSRLDFFTGKVKPVVAAVAGNHFFKWIWILTLFTVTLLYFSESCIINSTPVSASLDKSCGSDNVSYSLAQRIGYKVRKQPPFRSYILVLLTRLTLPYLICFQRKELCWSSSWVGTWSRKNWHRRWCKLLPTQTWLLSTHPHLQYLFFSTRNKTVYTYLYTLYIVLLTFYGTNFCVIRAALGLRQYRSVRDNSLSINDVAGVIVLFDSLPTWCCSCLVQRCRSTVTQRPVVRETGYE